MIKNIKITSIKFQKGFALVEVIAALGISALVITALISLSISTLRTSLDSKLLLEGTKVANREIELVRAYRDGNEGAEVRSWESFIADVYQCNGSTPCHVNTDDGTIGTGSFDMGSGAEKITRGFTVSKLDGTDINYNSSDPSSIPSVVRVSVSVTWKVGDKDKGSYIYTGLSNWRGR